VLEVLDCWGPPDFRPKARPTEILVACGDASSSLASLVWSTWSSDGAKATGTAWVNDCTPDCADGHFHSYPATVILSGTYPEENGVVLFSQLTEDIGGGYPRDQFNPNTYRLPDFSGYHPGCARSCVTP
jgi:hypothetical protein